MWNQTHKIQQRLGSYWWGLGKAKDDWEKRAVRWQTESTERLLPFLHKRFNPLCQFNTCLILKLKWGLEDVKVANWRATSEARNSTRRVMGSGVLSSFARDWLRLPYECSNCATHQKTLITLSPCQISLMFPLAKRGCGNTIKKIKASTASQTEVISFFIFNTLFHPLPSWASELAATQWTTCRLGYNKLVHNEQVYGLWFCDCLSKRHHQHIILVCFAWQDAKAGVLL